MRRHPGQPRVTRQAGFDETLDASSRRRKPRQSAGRRAMSCASPSGDINEEVARRKRIHSRLKVGNFVLCAVLLTTAALLLALADRSSVHWEGTVIALCALEGVAFVSWMLLCFASMWLDRRREQTEIFEARMAGDACVLPTPRPTLEGSASAPRSCGWSSESASVAVPSTSSREPRSSVSVASVVTAVEAPAERGPHDQRAGACFCSSWRCTRCLGNDCTATSGGGVSVHEGDVGHSDTCADGEPETEEARRRRLERSYCQDCGLLLSFCCVLLLGALVVIAVVNPWTPEPRHTLPIIPDRGWYSDAHAPSPSPGIALAPDGDEGGHGGPHLPSGEGGGAPSVSSSPPPSPSPGLDMGGLRPPDLDVGDILCEQHLFTCSISNGSVPAFKLSKNGECYQFCLPRDESMFFLGTLQATPGKCCVRGACIFPLANVVPAHALCAIGSAEQASTAFRACLPSISPGSRSLPCGSTPRANRSSRCCSHLLRARGDSHARDRPSRAARSELRTRRHWSFVLLGRALHTPGVPGHDSVLLRVQPRPARSPRRRWPADILT